MYCNTFGSIDRTVFSVLKMKTCTGFSQISSKQAKN